jgi:hypothetical protein
MEQQNTRMKVEEIPFDKLEKAGINRDFVTRMDNRELTDFLNGFRSQKLYTVNARINDEDYKIPAKLRLQRQEDGSVAVRVHPIQRLSIPDEYLGHQFTKEDKASLLNDKMLGKTVELTGRNGQKDRYYLGIDSKTNELIALRTKNIQVPDQIKGVVLTKAQKDKLAAGQMVTVKGMTGKDGRKFSANLQVNAADRNISFGDFQQEKGEELKPEKKQGVKPKIG